MMRALERDDVAMLERRIARERAARHQAEQLLEEKSRELFHANEALSSSNERLERGFIERTRQLRDALEKAQAAAEAKTRFLATISHELRTPLNAVLNYAEIICEDASDMGAREIADDARKITGSGKHLLTLINEILDYTKIESGETRLELVPFDVDAMIAEVVAMMAPAARRRDNEFRLSAPARLGEAVSDPVKIKQCLLNLVGNACKFTQNGVVSLEATTNEQGSMLTFTVTDSGVGMSPEQVARLFRPFAQGDETTTRRFGGTGLGLAISRTYARMIGGDVTVRSELDVGSEFTLRVPRRAPSPSEMETEDA